MCMYYMVATKINETLNNYYEKFTQNFSGILRACKMVELYTI